MTWDSVSVSLLVVDGDCDWLLLFDTDGDSLPTEGDRDHVSLKLSCGVVENVREGDNFE